LPVLNKIAFITVVYPGVQNYLADFFSSLKRQTSKDFDVIVFNDGFSNLDKFVHSYHQLSVQTHDCSGSPAKIRETAINWVKNQQYDYVLFGDADDYFAENRIEVCVDQLSMYDIVVNDVSLTDVAGVPFSSGYFSNRLANHSTVGVEQVREKNIFGLSNTGVRRKALTEVRFDSDLVAVDWYFFSTLLLRRKTAIFTNDTTTFYRQHRNNTVGFRHINEKQVLQAFAVKTKHFQCLSEFDPSFLKLANAYHRTWKKLKDKPNCLQAYCRQIEQHLDPRPFWWEEARVTENFYEN